MDRLKMIRPVAVALAGLLLWLQVCNKIPMVNALCGAGISCITSITVPGVMCSHQNADAACHHPCRNRGSRFYSDQACCLQDDECCCIPSYRNVDDGGEGEESSLQPADYRDPNNVIDYTDTAPYGADYRLFDFVGGPIDGEVSASSQPVDDQGENSSLPDDNDDGESSSGSNNDGENSLDPDNDGD